MGGSGGYAWVTSVAAEDQVDKALILARSLRLVRSAMKLVAIATPSLSAASKERTAEEFDLVVTTHDGDERKSRKEIERALKVHGFSLTLFETCAYLSPTMIVIKNCDELFDKGVPRSGTQLLDESLNLSAYLFAPEKGLYKDLKTVLESSQEHFSSLRVNCVSIEDPNSCVTGCGGSIVNFVKEHPSDLWRSGVELRELVSNRGSQTSDEKLAIATCLSILNEKDDLVHFPKNGSAEPVAIVGMSFRLPDCNSADEFWELLIQGKDAVRPVPPSRSTVPRTRQSWKDSKVEAGFLNVKIDEWDAKFFGTSPKEAAFVDPQQRILLEVTWEALEDAGIDPLSLHGGSTGIFVGCWMQDYQEHIRFAADFEFFRSYMGTGIATQCGRLSHFLGCVGPSISTESGCSSSMVAVHMAVRSLRLRESNLALACGVNLIVNPYTLEMAQVVLSPDYRCHTFDAKANGFARAEGAATLILKRLSDALKDGDNIWGLIRGTGVAQEGLSNSLGTPTVHCEARAMSQALRDAGLNGGDVDYVEAHGTGTLVGDPIEIAAIAKAYNSAARTEPLLVGSVKTNIGHTESASGIAGMIKVLLSMKHGVIPRHRNLEILNPEINLEAIPAKIPDEAVVWTKLPNKRRVAGVSSFGISGTDGHVILEEPPECKNVTIATHDVERPLHILKLSAKSPESFELMVAQYQALLEHAEEGKFEDICYSANSGRATFPLRGVILAEDCKQAATILKSRSFQTANSNGAARICFLFTGQGSQYPGMASELYATSPVFRLHFDMAAYILQHKYNISIREVMCNSREGDATLNNTLYSQPSIFCVEYALLKLWESWGVSPDYVLGHSLGEFTAAVAAGILELEDALHLVAVRSQLIDNLPRGKMLVVKGSKREVEGMVERFKSNNPHFWVDFAALNSPDQTVLAGNSTMIQDFMGFCSENGLKSTVLGSSHAFHSRHMDPILDAYGKAVSTVNRRRPRNNANKKVWPKYISGVAGRVVGPSDVDVDYWIRHTRKEVNFLDACKTAKEEGLTLFLENGPHPVLSAFVMRNLEGTNITVLSSLQRNGTDWSVLLESLGKLFLSDWSGSINWEGVDSGYPRARVALPFYPFNRKSVWLEVPPEQPLLHPLLGRRLPTASSNFIYESVLLLKNVPYLEDHVIGNSIIFPGAGYLEMCLVAGIASAMGINEKLSTPRQPIGVHNLKILSPMVVTESAGVTLQTVVSFEDEEYKVKICRRDYEGCWVSHATATFLPSLPTSLPSLPQLFDNMSEMTATGKSWEGHEIYQSLVRVGLKYGPAFQSIQICHQSETGTLFKLRRGFYEHKNIYSGLIHPILADAMVVAAMLWDAKSVRKLRIPVSLDEFVWLRRSDNPERFVRCGTTVEGKLLVVLIDGEGVPLSLMKGVEFVETSVKLVEDLGTQPCTLPKIWEEVFKSVPSPHENCLDLSGSPFNFTAELVAELKQFNSHSGEEAEHYKTLCEVTRASFLNALYQMGWSPAAGDIFCTRNILESLGIRPNYENYVNFFFTHLADVGIIEKVGSGEEPKFRFPLANPPSKQMMEMEALLKALKTSNKLPEYEVLKEIGKQLQGILMGKVDPLSLLFPEDRSKPSAAQFYQFFPRVHAAPLRRIIEGVVLPPQVRQQTGIFRVLEIGAGTGSFSRIILDIFEESGIPFEYHYTDVSAAFFPQAEKDFTSSGANRIIFKRLDMEEDSLGQGYTPEYFDMLFAGEVLHVAKDIKQTLSRLRRLLKPGGVLLLVETIIPDPRATFVFGLLPGYWRFQDFNFRKAHTTLTAPMWEEALSSAAFHQVTITPNYAGVHGLIVAVAGETSELGVTPNEPPKHGWIIFGGVHDELEEGLEKELSRLNRVVDIFKRGGGDSDISEFEFKSQVSGLLEKSVSSELEPEGILYLWGLQAEENQDQGRVSLPLLTICQVVSQLGKHAPKIVAVTRGLHLVCNSLVVNPSAGALSGLIKAIQNENSNLTLAQLDLSPEDSTAFQLNQLVSNLWADHPPILALRGGSILTPKLVAWKPQNHAYLRLPNGCSRFQLLLPETRLISDLELTFLPPYTLDKDEVEVEVKAVGLNFRDVLTVLKPTPLFDRFSAIGLDLAGVITKVGAGVTGRQVGDRILCMNLDESSTMPSHVKTKASATLPLPQSMTFSQGATIPTVFSTAYHSLLRVAGLGRGETLLVHTASGGVGLAAIQVARQVGAVVIATAGSPRKRQYLRNLGVEHVFDSRSLDFGKQVLRVTGGRGVDIVLNSLTGPGFVEESLAALATHGRFVEMSKLNVWSVDEVRERRPDVDYSIVDLTTLEEDDYLELHQVLERALEHNLVTPIPHERFDGMNIRGALNYLQQAKHIGKIVCVMPELREVQGQDRDQFHERTPLFNEQSTYLVTGGLGGVGFEVVKWILGSGGKHVVIASRSSPNSKIRQQLRSWNTSGKNVQAFAVDVGNYEQCRSLFERLGNLGFPPIRGVMHAAGVLSDGVLENQSWTKFRETYNPKVVGSWNLHQLTKTLPLEHFVLFSSFSASFGTPGQSNHSASNSFQDTLANYRVSLGLPATSVNWGNWGEVGVATEVNFPGMSPIRTAQGIRALEVFLRTGTRRAAVANIDSFQELVAFFPNACEFVYDKRLIVGTKTLPSSKLWNSDEFWAEVYRSPGRSEQLSFFKNLVKATMRNILRLGEAEGIDDDADFTSLGMDSLMVIEFKNGLQKVLGSRLTITAADLKDGNTPTVVAIRLLKILEGLNWKSDEELPSLAELKQLIREDSILPENVTPVGTLPAKRIDQVESILLTGVTGNLGPYLLRELSQREGISQIICLIRKKGKASPMERLKGALKKFGLVEEVNMSKVEVILGNISEARLGLSKTEYQALEESVDAVVHSAARVDHNAKYWRAPSSNKDNIRTANIQGVIHVLQFCTQVRHKHLFYASTMAAVARVNEAGGFSEEWQDVGAFDEMTFNWGYPLTKHVAEQLVRQAVERGLSCKAFRFPVIGGDSRDGRCDHKSNHSILRWLSALKLGAISEVTFPLPYIPADLCAQMSLSVFFNPKAGSDVYSLNQVTPDREEVLIEVAKEEFGIDIQLLPSEQFLKMLEAEDDSSPIAPFKRLYTEDKFSRNMLQTLKWFPVYNASPKNFFTCEKMKRFLPDFEDSLAPSHVGVRRDLRYLRDSGVFANYAIECTKHD